MKEELKSLIDTIKASGEDLQTKREDLDFIVERMQHLADYVNAVVMMSVQVQVLYAKELDQEELIYKIQGIDTKRKMVHDVAMDACVQIDRLCNAYGCDPFCGIEKELDADGRATGQNRHEFAVFIGKTVNQIFEDEIYIDRTDEFAKDISKQQMEELAGRIEEE